MNQKIFVCIVAATLGAIISLSPAQSRASFTRCESAFGLTESNFDKFNEELSQDLSDVPKFLRSIERPALAIKVESFLGAGWSGLVFKVRSDGKDLALKLFREGAFKEQEQSGVIIQQYLSKLGLAPQVDGIITKKDLIEIFENNRELLTQSGLASADEIEVGLMMELTSAKNIKNHPTPEGDRIVTEPVIKERVLEQARTYIETLGRLKIRPDDLDGVITDRGDLMLIDTAFYQRADFDSQKQADIFMSRIKDAVVTEAEIASGSVSTEKTVVEIREKLNERPSLWKRIFGRQ